MGSLRVHTGPPACLHIKPFRHKTMTIRSLLMCHNAALLLGKIQNPFLLLIIFCFSNPLPIFTGYSRCPCLVTASYVTNLRASPAAKIGKGHLKYPNVLSPPLKLRIFHGKPVVLSLCLSPPPLKTIPDQ